jgi:ribosomal protein S18 acetylase RimI-like enzyme
LKSLDGRTAEIKRMWVASEARGLGIGRRLLAELEAEATKLGKERLRLDTNRTLAEAKTLYIRAGFRLIPRYNDNPYAHLWFEKTLPQSS